MPKLLWTPLSISYLAQLILVTVIAGYFLLSAIRLRRSRGAALPTTMLAITFAGLGLHILARLLGATLEYGFHVYPEPWATLPGAVALLAYLGFAYSFPSTDFTRPWERRFVLVAGSLYLVGELYFALLRQALLADGQVEYRHPVMDMGLVIGFGWCLVVFLRQLDLALRDKAEPRPSHHWQACLKFLLFRSDAASQRAKAARAFFWVSVTPLALNAMLLVRGYGLLDGNTAEILTSNGFLFLLASFALVYLNYVPSSSSFMIKTVGVTLTVILAIVGTISWVISPAYSQAYSTDAIPTPNSTRIFTPIRGGGYRLTVGGPKETGALGTRLDEGKGEIELPFEFAYFGRAYTSLYVRESGMAGFWFEPFWRDFNHHKGAQPLLAPLAVSLSSEGGAGVSSDDQGVFVRSSPERVVVSWNRLSGFYRPSDIYSFQMELRPDGQIIFAYFDLPESPTPSLFGANATPFVSGIKPGVWGKGDQVQPIVDSGVCRALPQFGLVEHYHRQYLEYLDRAYRPMAWFLLASSGIVLLLLPAFFSVNLVRPLRALLQGVDRFRQGELRTQSPVIYNDEIGHLASSFNVMAKAQADLVDTLEDKVAERSEAAARLAGQNAKLDERNRLSGELHDAVSQTLFASNLVADTVPGLWERDPQQALAAVQQVRGLNAEAMSEIRTLLAQSRPGQLTGRRFGALLVDLANQAQRNGEIDVEVEIGVDRELPDDVQVNLFRVAQESLQNIVKHAEATQVLIEFDGLEDQSILVIRDDGTGFDTDSLPPGHHGLTVMAERLSRMGGSLEIDSQEGEGTTITAIWMPNDS